MNFGIVPSKLGRFGSMNPRDYTTVHRPPFSIALIARRIIGQGCL